MKAGVSPLAITCNLHRNVFPSCRWMLLLSIFKVAVLLFEEMCEVRTSCWLYMNIRGASRRQYVFIQQSSSTANGSDEGMFCLVVRSSKGRKSSESATDLTGTDRTAQYLVAFVFSCFYTTILSCYLACFQFIVTQTAAAAAVCVTFD